MNPSTENNNDEKWSCKSEEPISAQIKGISSTISMPNGNGTGPDLNDSSAEQIIIKAQLREDIFRFSVPNEDITYDELVLKLQKLFRGQFKSDDDIVIKYKDEDGDMVTINDSPDLSFALQCCQSLKLRIFLKKDDELKNQILKNLPLGAVRSELRELRDKVNCVLDLLDFEEEKKIIHNSSGMEWDSSTVEKTFAGKTKKEQPSAPVNVIQPSPGLAREFDPLQQGIAAKSQTQITAPSPTPTAPAPVSQFQNEPSQPPLRQQPASITTAPEVSHPPALPRNFCSPWNVLDHHQNMPQPQQQLQINYQPQQQQQQQQQQQPYIPNAQQQQPPPPQQQQQQGAITSQAKPVVAPPPMGTGYPTTSTPTSMTNQQHQFRQPYPTSGHFSTPATPFTAQARPTGPASVTGPNPTGPTPQQQQQAQYPPDMYRQGQVAPGQGAPNQPSYPRPTFGPYPPSMGPAGPTNPYSRPTGPSQHY